MKKKGFTLIELIVVIALLGLISAIVFPVITSTLNNSKQKAYETQKKQVIKSARQYFYENPLKLPKLVNGNTSSVSVEQLIKDGYIEDKVKDPRDNNCLTGYIKVSVENNKYVYSYDDKTSKCD